MSNYSNSTNDTFPGGEEQELEYDCPLSDKVTAFEKGIKVAVYVGIITVSLIGNLLIIVVTRRTRRMKTVPFHLIVNMALADLFTTLINMPEVLIVEIRDSSEWFHGSIGQVSCKLLPFCQLVCVYCSILSLLTIAFDRFCAIVLPLKRLMTRKLAKIIIFSTWLVPCFASWPMLVANKVILIEDSPRCREEWPAPFDSLEASRDYTIILFVLFYVLPLITISTLYSCVIYKIWQRKIPGNHYSATNRMHLRSKRKALKMFIAVVVCFALCWLPYHVMFFLSYYNEEYYNCGIPDAIWFAGAFLGHAISAINPCIYMIFNKDYRTGTKRLVTSCCKKNASLFPDMNTASGFHTRAGVNEHLEMATFHSHSPRIQGLTQRKVEKAHQSLAMNDVFLVRYNKGFVN